jgi:protein-L-isoaspartate(D-aspartate) O-methyltransferase
MTQCLEIEATSKVLEIGTGSGYHTAILAKLAYEVYSIERVKPLLDEAFERLYSLNLRNVHFKYGDGLRGWQEFVPFDRILIAAGAPSLPRSLLLSQLADGGLAVLPVGPQDEQMLVQVRRKGDRLESTNLCPCRFVKLIGEGAWQE